MNLQGVSYIQTSTGAAKVLRPVAYDFALVVFALGIVGSGLRGLR